jgi:hypothetical protein
MMSPSGLSQINHAESEKKTQIEEKTEEDTGHIGQIQLGKRERVVKMQKGKCIRSLRLRISSQNTKGLDLLSKFNKLSTFELSIDSSSFISTPLTFEKYKGVCDLLNKSAKRLTCLKLEFIGGFPLFLRYLKLWESKLNEKKENEESRIESETETAPDVRFLTSLKVTLK